MGQNNTGMTDTNLHRKAASCRADLEFLLSIIPATGFAAAKATVRRSIATLKDPTEQKITAAWQLAATVQEEIRKI